MPFAKMKPSKYPPRLWSLVGYPGSGKSTFATRMRQPLLPIDADHRFSEVLHLAKDVYSLSEVPEDNVSADRIAAILPEKMPGSGIETIIVDSLTSIITPLVIQAIMDKDLGREKNLAVAFRTKALAMRQLQDAVTRWGTDVLWLYHLHDARDEKAKEVTKATVSATELVRLTRSINMHLEIVIQDAKRGAKVVWARRGRSGMTLWDESETWENMPERIEAAVYDGLTLGEMDRIELSAPEIFPSSEIAISWAMDQGAFDEIAHARNAYEKIKHERNPTNARQMATLWIADVQHRLEEKRVEEGAGG